MIRVLITDKNVKLVENLRYSINKSRGASVDQVSHSLKDCREQLAKQLPDILLLGLAFSDGNGVDFCAEIGRTFPRLKILIMTDNDDYLITKRVMSGGASGFIRKDALSEEFVYAITTIARGRNYIGGKIGMEKKDEQRDTVPEWLKPLERVIPKLIGKECSRGEAIERLTRMAEMIGNYRKQIIVFQLADDTQTLNTGITDEYLKILIEDMLLKGYSNWETAGELDINIDTVRLYRMGLIQRLGTRNSMLFAKRKANDIINLTPKETQLLRLIAAGFTNREIAGRLYLSEDTVKSDRRDLILKLGSESSMDMVMDALRQGLIKLEDIDYLLSND